MGMVFGYMGGIEEPAYNVSFDRHVAEIPYEIREYGKRYAIETYYDAGYTSPSFRRLAGFIGVGSAPRNDGGQAIAMTAPVTMQQNQCSPGGQKNRYDRASSNGKGKCLGLSQKDAVHSPQFIRRHGQNTQTNRSTGESGRAAPFTRSCPPILGLIRRGRPAGKGQDARRPASGRRPR